MSDKSDTRNILELIYACGFSTKSNFNRAFKKHEGMKGQGTFNQHRSSLTTSGQNYTKK